MKKLITLILLLISVIVYGQYDDDYPNDKKTKKSLVTINLDEVFPVKDNRIYYTEVVELNDSTTKDILYIRGLKIITDIFKSGKDVTQLADKENGIIIAKGFYAKGHNDFLTNPQIWYTIKIEVKNYKFRYIISDVTYKFDVYFSGAHRSFDSTFEDWINKDQPMKQKIKDATMPFLFDVDNHFKSIINSLKTQMQLKEESW